MPYVRAALLLVLPPALGACCWFRPYRTPAGVEGWQDRTPPSLSLHEMADRYQSSLVKNFQTPEGLIKYRRNLAGPDAAGSYGNMADGTFFTGIYLGSQSLRHAATGSPAALEEVRKSLGALRLLHQVTGKRGLLARHFAPAGTIEGGTWRASTSQAKFAFRSDVSKDQYAGCLFGLGLTLALVDDPAIRSGIAELAAALADHLLENDLRIIDADGRPTTFGNLRGRIAGIPQGGNAAIALALFRVAADSTGDERYREFYRRLVKEGYARLIHWTDPPLWDRGKRVNRHMAYLALYTLLLLEQDPAVLAELRASEQKIWNGVREDRNAFFAFVHAVAAKTDSAGPAAGPGAGEAEGVSEGRAALFEFPEDKVERPVDLTREDSFPRSWFVRSPDCTPLSRRPLPVYLRPRGSSLWVSNPYALVGKLGSRGETETAGVDYLQAYWLGRRHGFVGPGE